MNNYIVENKDLLKTIRNIRNLLLKETDKYFLIDFPIAYEQQMIIKAYRQELRDFINNNEIKILAGEKVEFPPQPDFIELAPSRCDPVAYYEDQASACLRAVRCRWGSNPS